MKTSDKTMFRRITLPVVLSLAALAGLQLFWVVGMYGDMERRFVEKVTAAMERAAYDELVTRKRAPRKIELTTDISGGGGSPKVYSYTTGGGGSLDTLHGNVAAINTFSSATPALDSLVTGITMSRGGDTRLRVITIVPTREELGRRDFARYDSLLRLNLARADILLPYRLSVVEGGGGKELQALGDEVSGARTFDIPIGSRRASVVRLAIENPNRAFVGEMTGLVASSVLTVLLLAFTLIYLMRTLFRQKTLEEMRVDLTHNITHELKTPIAVAYAAGDALLNFGADDDKAKREKYLRTMQAQLRTLSDMVERILAVSLEDGGDATLNRRRVELLPVVRALIEGHELRGWGRFSIDVPQGLAVYADPFRLNIALGNLIDNAVKYSGDAPVVNVTARRDDRGVRIGVTDNGPGIPAAERGRIFEKFYRIPTGDIHAVKGFGLGLYNVRRIVEEHGGRVCVLPAPERGSTFTLCFPDLPDDERA